MVRKPFLHLNTAELQRNSMRVRPAQVPRFKDHRVLTRKRGRSLIQPISTGKADRTVQAFDPAFFVAQIQELRRTETFDRKPLHLNLLWMSTHTASKAIAVCIERSIALEHDCRRHVIDISARFVETNRFGLKYFRFMRSHGEGRPSRLPAVPFAAKIRRLSLAVAGLTMMGPLGDWLPMVRPVTASPQILFPSYGSY
jgi:hypothetical protein